LKFKKGDRTFGKGMYLKHRRSELWHRYLFKDTEGRSNLWQSYLLENIEGWSTFSKERLLELFGWTFRKDVSFKNEMSGQGLPYSSNGGSWAFLNAHLFEGGQVQFYLSYSGYGKAVLAMSMASSDWNMCALIASRALGMFFFHIFMATTDTLTPLTTNTMSQPPTSPSVAACQLPLYPTPSHLTCGARDMSPHPNSDEYASQALTVSLFIYLFIY
jgi:hypothetical protein